MGSSGMGEEEGDENIVIDLSSMFQGEGES
jgi:hypothetical protein